MAELAVRRWNLVASLETPVLSVNEGDYFKFTLNKIQVGKEYFKRSTHMVLH